MKRIGSSASEKLFENVYDKRRTPDTRIILQAHVRAFGSVELISPLWHKTKPLNRDFLLAHLSQRLIGELIGCSLSCVRPSSSVRRKQFQISSSPKPLTRSKPNFILISFSLLTITVRGVLNRHCLLHLYLT